MSIHWSCDRGCRRRHPATRAAAVLACAVGAFAGAVPGYAAATSAHWLGATSGAWDDASKWSTAPAYPTNNSPLGAVYDISIAAAGSPYTVALINNSQITLENLELNSPDATLQLSSGTLAVNGTFGVRAGTFRMDGGRLLDTRVEAGAGGASLIAGGTLQNVTFAGNTVVSGNYSGVTLDNGLTLDNAAVSLRGIAAGIYFRGAHELGGTGSIAFDIAGVGNPPNVIAPQSGGSNSLTIGPNVTIRTGTGNGTVGDSLSAMVNHGTISGDTTDKSITVTGTGWSNTGTIEASAGSVFAHGVSWTNTGTLRSSGSGRLTVNGRGMINYGTMESTGGTLRVDGSNWTNNGTIHANGGSLVVDGLNWTNAGTIRLATGNNFIGGNTTAGQLGRIERTGGSLTFTAYLELQGSNFDVAKLQGGIFGGTFKDGTVSSADGQPLITNGRVAKLENLTLATDLDHTGTANGRLYFENGLTLADATIRLGVSKQFIASASNAAQTLGGHGEIIVEDEPNSYFPQSEVGGDLVTIGPGITIRSTGSGNGTTGLRIRTRENFGAILAQSSSMPVSFASPTWSNSGSVAVSAGTLTLNNQWTNTAGGSVSATGAKLVLAGQWSNAGVIEATDGAFIELQSAPASSSTGTMSLANSTLRVATTMTTPQIAAIARTNSVVSIFGPSAIVQNAGQTIQLDDPAGPWRLDGGRVVGGTISGSNGASIGSRGKLDGVTLAGSVSIASDPFDILGGSLALADGASFRITGFSPTIAPLQAYTNSTSITGNGEIVLDADVAGSVKAAIMAPSAAVTFGPGVTVRTGGDNTGGGLAGNTINPMTLQGVLSAQHAGSAITVTGRFVNQGLVEARNGGQVMFSGSHGLTGGDTLNGGQWFVGDASAINISGSVRTNAADITLDGPTSQFPALAQLNNITGKLALTGGRTFTTTGITTHSGTLTIGAGSGFTSGGSFRWTGGTVDGAGTLVAPSANISGDVTRTGSGTMNFTTITIAAGKRLDLTDGKLITREPAGSATAGLYDGVQGLVQSGYNFTAWNGAGIVTSMADAKAGVTTIGVATAAQVRGLGETETDTWAGQTITGASTLAMYTYAGDANLDGQIDAGDYGIIDNFVQIAGSSGYGNGDFNYDGFIDAGDYGIIDNNVQAQNVPFPISSSMSPALSGVTAVPEPSACGFLIVAAAPLLRRRRRP